MTENMQADVLPSRQAGFVRCCLKFSGKCDEDGQTVTLGQKNALYCAAAHLAANNMGEEIKAELYQGGDKMDELTYSVYEYLNAIRINNDMAKATLLYGLAAEDYFNGTDNSAEINEIGGELQYGYAAFDAANLLNYAN